MNNSEKPNNALIKLSGNGVTSQDVTGWYRMRLFVVTLICEWFWLGRFKPSGTVGSIAALPFLSLIMLWQNPHYLWIFAIFTFCIGLVAVHFYQQHYGKKDHAQIVIDEVCGQTIAVAMLPFAWETMVLAFLLFRLFDIAKPYPIHIIDKKIPNALGVMIDDVIAGLYAGLTAIVLSPWLKVMIVGSGVLQSELLQGLGYGH